MHKMLLVARHEFWRYVTRRGFLFAVFGLPLLLVGIFVVTIAVVGGRADDPVGVVDHSGLMLDPAAYNPTLDEDDAPLRRFDTEEAAEAALFAKEIQAFFVVPAGYPEEPALTMYHLGDPFEGVQGDIYQYLRRSLLANAGVDPAVARVLAQGFVNLEFTSLREAGAQDEFSGFLFPFVVGVLLVMSIFTTSGYLLQTVVDEKENRTMEILITSLSPEQLVTGKILGLVVLGLVQTTVWAIAAVIAFLVARANIPAAAALRIPPTLLPIALAWFIPFYLMMASFMATIGVSVTQVSEGQQASSIISLLAAAPFWLLFVLITSPDGPLSVALSLIPFTSPLSILIRWPLTAIPLWQLLLSWLLLAGTAVLSLFMVGRVLRLGMLRYGQRLKLREVVAAVRGNKGAP